MIACSACLAGKPCRYDGKSKPNSLIEKLANDGKVVLVCPEQLGGLPTPRVPSGLTGDGGEVWKGNASVINREGKNVTAEFKRGAQEALRIVRESGADFVVLKQHSPSCGLGSAGGADGCRKPYDGVAAALFKAQGLKVISDEDFAGLQPG
ncbi:MAG: DUF523 domain-containing protein [bacterium]|nr:DUF523 domain-containing protein [bacterium]